MVRHAPDVSKWGRGFRLTISGFGNLQTASYPRLLALRASAFSVAEAAAVDPVIIDSTSPVEVLFMAPPDLTDVAARVYIHSTIGAGPCPEPALPITLTYLLGDRPEGFFDHANDNCSYRTTYGMFGTMDTAATDPPRLLAHTTDTSRSWRTRGAFIQILSLPR